MIRIAICDDFSQMIETLKQQVLTFMEQEKEPVSLQTYEKSELLKFDLQEGMQFDLILSDIEMPGVDGMELAGIIRMYLPEVVLIFVTSHMKYAVDAYEYGVFRYIPKNMLEERLLQALKDALQMIRMQTESCYRITQGSHMEKVSYRRILYIRKDGKNSVFTLKQGEVLRERKSLNQVYQELDSEEFVFVDRGCIVNLLHISRFYGDEVELDNGEKLPVSRGRLNETKVALQTLWSRNI